MPFDSLYLLTCKGVSIKLFLRNRRKVVPVSSTPLSLRLRFFNRRLKKKLDKTEFSVSRYPSCSRERGKESVETRFQQEKDQEGRGH